MLTKKIQCANSTLHFNVQVHKILCIAYKYSVQCTGMLFGMSISVATELSNTFKRYATELVRLKFDNGQARHLSLVAWLPVTPHTIPLCH